MFFVIPAILLRLFVGTSYVCMKLTILIQYFQVSKTILKEKDTLSPQKYVHGICTYFPVENLVAALHQVNFCL